jgi:2,3-bisphosphoglycerate-independent phosphoglycerate mutase
MEVIDVPGATGYLDTNYKGKAEYALRALKKNDVVFVHVEAPDEAGHEGDVKKKIRAIEDFDRLVVGTILKNIQLPTSNLKTKDERQTTNYKLLVLPDHPTPIKAMTHTSDAVPFVMYPSSVVSCQWLVNGYNEKEIGKTKFRIKAGNKLLEFLFRRDPLASRSCKMEKVAM